MASGASATTDMTTVILKFDLGEASKFEQSAFPRASLKQLDSNIERGTILLRATVEEMSRIQESGVNLANRQDFILDTHATFEALAYKQANLKNKRKTFNPFKMLMNYRAAQIFHTAALNLYLQTKHVSDRIQKEAKDMQTVSRTELLPVNGEVPPNAVISGIAIDLAGPLTEDLKRTIMGAVAAIRSHAIDPFADNPQIPQLFDGEEAMSLLSQDESQCNDDQESVFESPLLGPEPTSPASSLTATTVHVQNLILAENSTITGFTSNHNSRRSGGSTTVVT